MSFIGLQPFTRGAVHATARDAIWKQDSINITPMYFAQQYGLDLNIAGMRAGRRLLRSPEIKALLSGNETMPGFECEPQGGHAPKGVPNNADNGSHADWATFVTSVYFPYNHAMDTCAMMSRDLGGVVGSDFKVHGTANLRVVDASISPMGVTAHLTGLMNGLAKLASDLILANMQ